MSAKIVDLALGPPNPACQPEELDRLAFWSGGLSVTPSTPGRLAFADIAGCAVFGHGPEGAIHWMIFPEGRPRALCVRLEKADFTTVQGFEGRPAVDKLRAVLRLIVKRAPQVVIDRSTVAFLKGHPPMVFSQEASVLAAAFFNKLKEPAALTAGTAPAAAPLPGPLPAPRPNATPSAIQQAQRPATSQASAAPRPHAAPAATQRSQDPPTSRPLSGPLAASRPAPSATQRPQRPATRRPRAASPRSARQPPQKTKKVPWKWVLGGVAVAAVVFVALGVLLIAHAARLKRPKAPPRPLALPTYGLSVTETPEVLDIRHSRYPDVDRLLRQALPQIHTAGTGSNHIVLQDKKKVPDLGTIIVTREAEFYVYYTREPDRLSLRIDFVGARKLSKDDEFRVGEAMRRGEWEGQVPLKPTSSSPYTVAVDLRSLGRVGIAEVFRDGISTARFTWGASFPEAGKLDISKARAVATSAKQLFDYYVLLERSYNCGLVDLYASSAKIKNVRRYPGGQVKEMEVTGAFYKKMILENLPRAERLGDQNVYSDVTFTPERAGKVRIRASRYSKREDYSSPLSILTTQQAGGYWLIIEELSESRP